MKRYKMATISNPSITKQPLKALEIPFNKFSEEVIPHHQKVFEQHKNNIHRLIVLSNLEQLAREVKDKKRTIKQLRDLLYELDTLRTQVEDKDLDLFDNKTMPLRNSILKLTKSYQDIEKTVEQLINKSQASSELSQSGRENPFEGASQIQIQGSLNDLKLRQEGDRLNRVQEIQKDTEDLHSIYSDLHGMITVQGESITQVEENVTSAQENVNRGFKDIIKAHKLNAVAYPATGAFVGTLLGGPIGFFAGLKVGGAAALGCAVAGYAGGLFLKKHKDTESNETEAVINNENNENHTITQGVKKDI